MHFDENDEPLVSIAKALHRIADNLGHIASGIAPVGALPGTDATGGHITSLTEAVMGLTAAVVQHGDSGG